MLGRLRKLEDTLATIAQLERNMQKLREWLIETEHQINMPLVFQHCDFAEIERLISQQQVTVFLNVFIFCSHKTEFF